MTHDELRELTGGYALGVLGEEERRALEAHLATCPACAKEVREFETVTAALAFSAPQQDPPAALRDRVVRAVAQSPAPRHADEPTRHSGRALPIWLSAAASIAALALGLYAMTLRDRIGELEGRLREANARADSVQRELAVARASDDDARRRLAVLTAGDVRVIDLTGQKTAPGASGRAFWSPSHGRLVFMAASLPPLAAGRQYQLWVIPPGGTPVSAGMLDLQPDGQILSTLADSSTVNQVGTVAVSEEPAGGVPSPTGPIVLAGSL
jgi:anti-sigma-K factor RskA